MPAPSPENQWYVVHVLSGQEGRVRDRILRQRESEEMGDYIYEVLVPTEMVSEEKVAVAPLRRSSALTRATSSCSTNGLTR